MKGESGLRRGYFVAGSSIAAQIGMSADVLNYFFNNSGVIAPRLVDFFRNVQIVYPQEAAGWALFTAVFISPFAGAVAGKTALAAYDRIKPYSDRLFPKARDLLTKLKSRRDSSKTGYQELYSQMNLSSVG